MSIHDEGWADFTHMTRTSKLTAHELFSLNPAIDWPKYFEGVGAPDIGQLNVAVPNFFRTLESVIVQPTWMTSRLICGGNWFTPR